ncbi:hypothetical protein DUI87_01452 [Hirundo rustica rustica]|uniref:Uncharacterized protein n=1 Tax=Hirundo rustica rustica TaxID=333673 RepID=A0A3M0LC20_HIRRU|nr:hypothetical protein DUI87_01452 [Hirundo rustica rustica]
MEVRQLSHDDKFERKLRVESLKPCSNQCIDCQTKHMGKHVIIRGAHQDIIHVVVDDGLSHVCTDRGQQGGHIPLADNRNKCGWMGAAQPEDEISRVIDENPWKNLDLLRGVLTVPDDDKLFSLDCPGSLFFAVYGKEGPIRRPQMERFGELQPVGDLQLAHPEHVRKGRRGVQRET